MEINEYVTFANPSQLERKRDKLEDKDLLNHGLRGKDSRVLLFWQGMPMVDSQSIPVFLEPKPKILDFLPTRVFLGTNSGIDYYAGEITLQSTSQPNVVAKPTLFDTKIYQHPDFPNYQFQNLRILLPLLGESLNAELLATSKALLGWHKAHKFCSSCGASSGPSHTGWSRICPQCKSEHFPRCDPVVIMLITHQNRLLLGRSYHWPRGMHSLLAGFMEPGESIESAVKREVYEEAEIVVDNISYVASQPWPFPTSLMIGCKGIALTEEIKPQIEEIENALWLEREEVMEIYGGLRTDITLPRKGSIAEFMIRKWLEGTLT